MAGEIPILEPPESRHQCVQACGGKGAGDTRSKQVLQLESVKCRFSKCGFGAELETLEKNIRDGGQRQKIDSKDVGPTFSLCRCAGIGAALVKEQFSFRKCTPHWKNIEQRFKHWGGVWQRWRLTLSDTRKRAEYCFGSTVSEKRTHWPSLSFTADSGSSAQNSVSSLWRIFVLRGPLCTPWGVWDIPMVLPVKKFAFEPAFRSLPFLGAKKNTKRKNT